MYTRLLALASVAGCGVSSVESIGDRVDRILLLTGDVSAGHAIYGENCQECHGASGLGEDDPTHPGIGENLTEVVEHPDEIPEYVQVILLGEEDMPPFEDLLTDQDVADVLAWLQDGLIEAADR
jgi:mono/diheme cytochrome c family protein